MRIQRIFAALLIALTLSALGSIAPQPAVATHACACRLRRLNHMSTLRTAQA